MRPHTALLTALLIAGCTHSASEAAPTSEVTPAPEVASTPAPEGACADQQTPALEVRRHPTVDGRALLEVVCAYYPYQEALEIWLEGPAGVVGAGQGGAPLAFAGLAWLDAGAGALEVLEKGRGLGDCGVWRRYRVSGAGLALEERRERRCDAPVEGEELPLPSEWPLVAPAAK